MGSIITLGINKMEIDWGKNYNFKNYSNLFQEKDMDKSIPYYYVSDEDEYKAILKYKKGASKKLLEVKDRLDFLGYTIKGCEKKYKDQISEYEYSTDEKCLLTFKQLYLFIYNLNISKIDNVFSEIKDYSDGDYDLGEYFNRAILKDEEINAKLHKIFKKLGKNHFIIGEFFENIDPYIILRILAENKVNLEYNVEWRYEDNVENKWISKEELKPKISDKDKILIVTEGKTDSYIIKKSLENLYPNITDFFYFIDMKENYPFTGVGNLSNFCLGLSKINILNNVIILFDNDTAGLELFHKVKDITKPENLLICHLPNHQSFKKIITTGPSGNKKSNINGKAVAIECFLDFFSVDVQPKVRWNNYNKNMKRYHGELENKDKYFTAFKNAKLNNGTYDISKLKYLIDYLVMCWTNR